MRRMSMKIKQIIGREIYDSRGYPTIECSLVLDKDVQIIASVPSGASRGTYEAVPLRDGGDRLEGQGVLKAIENLEEIIAPALIGQEPNIVQMDAAMIDLDGTDDKSNLGANAILAASMAVCKAQAFVANMDIYEFIAYICDFETFMFPGPMLNVINGGIHANNNLQIQEFMIVPQGMGSFRDAFEVSTMVFHALKRLLKENGKAVAVGDEGGFAPDLKDEIEALDYLLQAIESVQMPSGGSIMIALDIAASQFYNSEKQYYLWQGKKVSSQELIDWYEQLIDSKKYPIYSIEDGLHEDDWDGWAILRKTLGPKVRLVGDDIFVTNPQRIWEAIESGIADTVLIKPNQIGTVTETLQAIKLCKEYDVKTVVSHRSGETNDSFIADLAVGVSADHIKAGACSRGERLAKYNRLLKIEDDLLFADEF